MGNLGAGDGTAMGGQPLGVVAVPEPSAMALMSLASLGLLRRKRR